MAKKNGSERHGIVRRNIELYPQAVARLEKLRAKTEAHSDSDVVRLALRVLEQFVEDREHGCQILVRDSNGEETAVRMF